MVQLHVPRRRVSRGVGWTACVRCSNQLAALAAGNCRAHEWTMGFAKECVLLSGRAERVAVVPKAKSSGARALSPGKVQTE
jgi:hypothetical protein